MPTVPRYTSQTSPQVIEGPGFRASASPDAFGAAIGRGMQALGAGAEDLSTVFAAHAVQMQTQDNATEVDDLVTKGMLGINNLNYGDDGYYTKQKKQAVDAFEPAKAGLLKIKDDLAGQASNPAVRKAFDTAMRPQIIYNLQGMSSHYAGQRKAYQEDVFKGRVGTLEDSIGLNYANKEMFNDGLDQLRKLYADHGVDNGQPIDAVYDQYMTAVHKIYGKAIGMQALHDPEGAQREADANQDMLGPDQYMAISQRLLPSLNAAAVEDFVDANKFGSPGVKVQTFANAADAANRIIQAIPGTIATSIGPAKSAAGKAARVSGSYHELPTGSQAIDIVNPNLTLDQLAGQVKAQYGNAVKVIVEGPGAAHSTGPHVHVQWEKSVTAPMTALGVREAGAQTEDVIKARAEEAFPGNPLLQKQALQQWKLGVKEAEQDARFGKQDAVNTVYTQLNADLESHNPVSLDAYLKNPTLAAAIHSPALTDVDRNALLSKINTASRVPHTTTPEELSEWARLKGMAEAPNSTAAFLKQDILHNKVLAGNVGMTKELLNLQIRLRNKDAKAVDAPINHALSLRDIHLATQKMGLVNDPTDPNSEESTNYFKFVNEYKEMIDTYISVNNKKPSDNDLRHMFNQLATVQGGVQVRNGKRYGDQWAWEAGAAPVVGNIPNATAQRIASALRLQGVPVTAQAITDEYTAFLAAGGK